LTEGSQQKEHVEKELELIIKYFWNESYNVIFCVFDQVVVVVNGLDLSME
jgi:hypothetical protein